MKNVIDFAETRFAVVEARRSQAEFERFVIAYSSEQSLRQTIDASRIIASGFFSREEAARHCDAPAPVVAA